MRLNCIQILLLTAYLVFPIVCFGQTVAIELMQENSLKVQNNNYIKVVSAGVNCDSILLKADAIISYEGNCIWKVAPNKFFRPFDFRLKIFEKKGLDTLELHEKVFKTTKLDPLRVNSRITQTSITTEELINIGELRTFEAYSKYRSYETKVKSFKAIALRNDQVLFYHNNISYDFDEILIEKIRNLKGNDVLHFIEIENLDLDSIYLNPIPFKIEIKDSK